MRSLIAGLIAFLLIVPAIAAYGATITVDERVPTGYEQLEQQLFPLPKRLGPKMTHAVAAGPTKSNSGQQDVLLRSARMLERSVPLTIEEYEIFRNRVLRAPPASPWDVTHTFLAVQGPKIAIGLPIFLLFLVIVRRLFRSLWDQDVTGNAYASAVVLASLVLACGYVVGVLIQA